MQVLIDQKAVSSHYYNLIIQLNLFLALVCYERFLIILLLLNCWLVLLPQLLSFC